MRRMLEGKGVCWRVCVLVLACRLHSCVSLPAEQPTRFSLNTGEANRRDVAAQTSTIEQGRELLGRIADAIRIGTGRFVNSVTLARNIIAEWWEALESQSNVDSMSAAKPEAPQEQAPLGTATPYPAAANAQPNTGDMTILLNETGQSILEKPISKPITGILESFLQPAPLVDTIKEEERYGNTGKYTEIREALVNGYEGFSNFLNSLIEIPRNAVQKKSRGFSEMLSKVGARLVGLA